MIEITNSVVFGFDPALRGMRNPFNSWDKGDSRWYNDPLYDDEHPMFIHDNPTFAIGENDHKLAMKLIKAGSDHRKFLRMIQVWVDIKAPLYWWKEFDTYRVGTTANSCSTMHTLHKRDLTLEDFSLDGASEDAQTVLKHTLTMLNCYRREYVETKSVDAWRALIQLLPSGFMQLRTVNLNYAVLRNMYYARKGHKLTEWETFRKWCESLPYSEFITEV